MERLLGVLDGDTKRVVLAIVRNGLFYATALKALKREFGNLYAVSFLKLKAVLDQSQVQTDDQKGLKQSHQQLKTVITSLTSMGCFSSINSTENVIKANVIKVMRLPQNLRTSYYKSFDNTNFNENNINLISFERWLANKIHSLLNPIATLIESTIRSKGSGNQGDKSNKLKHDKKLRCWFCRDSHKISDCTVLKATPVDDRREFVKKNKLCFNCLSSDHMISQCRSKQSCKVSGCNKRHHTLLH